MRLNESFCENAVSNKFISWRRMTTYQQQFKQEANFQDADAISNNELTGYDAVAILSINKETKKK